MITIFRPCRSRRMGREHQRETYIAAAIAMPLRADGEQPTRLPHGRSAEYARCAAVRGHATSGARAADIMPRHSAATSAHAARKSH